MTDRSRQTTTQMLPQLDQFDFHQHLEASTGIVLVLFTSPLCGGCHHLRRVLLQVREQQPGWQFFEVDAQREPGLTSEFEVFHLPTIFLFQDGSFHCELAAEASIRSIIEKTRQALHEPPAEAP